MEYLINNIFPFLFPFSSLTAAGTTINQSRFKAELCNCCQALENLQSVQSAGKPAIGAKRGKTRVNQVTIGKPRSLRGKNAREPSHNMFCFACDWFISNKVEGAFLCGGMKDVHHIAYTLHKPKETFR